MTTNLVYRYGQDNIFDFPFMDDYTTILSLKDDGVDISSIAYQDEDDFYSYSEKKTYTENELKNLIF